MTARRRAAALATLAIGAACVKIETGPNGLQSARLANVPPSVVIGDTLRDSAGRPMVLQATGYDVNGNPLGPTMARVRYTYVPDTTVAGVRDTALVVDSATGVVRATGVFTRAQGRVAAVVGEQLQILDTVAIVPVPDSVLAEAFTVPVLRFDCRDEGGFPVAIPDTGAATFGYNTVRLPTITVRGDSSGTRVAVRRRLVRWDVVASPFPGNAIPRALRRLTGTDSVPAIAITGPDVLTDALRPVDTTSTAGGPSSVRLRVRPTAIGRAVIATDTFSVLVRAIAQPGPRAIRNDTVTFRVQLQRGLNPTITTPAACP